MRSNVVSLAKRQLSAAFGLLLAVFIFGNSSLFAAPIVFKSPVNINSTNSTNTAVSDAEILSLGTSVFAYNFFGAATVNGVSFASTNSTTGTGNLGLSVTGATWFGGYRESVSGAVDYLSSSYQSLLRAGIYSDGTNVMTVSLNGLTANRVYAVQLWGNESRNFTGSYDRSDIVTSAGGNSVVLDFNWANQVGSVGQYVLGTFVAGSTSQTFTLQGTTVSSGASTQINAIQLRDVTDAIGIWTGAVNGSWDNTTANWSGGANFSTYASLPTGIPLKFQDTNGSGQTVTNSAITLAASGFTNVGSVNFTAGTVNYTIASAGGTIGLGGTASLNKSGASKLTVSGTHSFTGGVNLTGGTLLAASLGALPNASVTVAAGAKLDLGGFDQTIALLTNNGSVTNSGGSPVTLTLTNSFAGTGVFSGSLNLAMANNGTSLVTVPLALNFAGALTNSGTGNSGNWASSSGTPNGSVLLTGALGAGVTKLVQDSATSSLVVYANNGSFTGPVEIRQGVLALANNSGAVSNVLGSGGVITVGTGAGNATLAFAGRAGISGATTGGGNYTLSNPISVAGSGLNLIAVTDWGLTLSSPITLSSSLTLALANSNGSALTLNGTVTGTGNLTLTNSCGTSNLSSFAINQILNNAGSISFANTAVLGGVAGTVSAPITISGGIGSNVTSINQNGLNAVTIQTGSVNVNPAGLAFNLNTSTGMTVTSPTTGSGALTLNINSTGSITLSGAIGHTGGTFINRYSTGSYTINNLASASGPLNFGGTATSALTYAGALGTNVPSVVQSGSGALTLSGAVTVGAAGKNLVVAGAGAMTLSGAMSGTGDLVMQPDGSGVLTLSNAVNISGSIINIGTGSTVVLGTVTSIATKGAAILNGAIGANVTKVVQNSPTSSIVLNATNTAYAGPVEIQRGALVIGSPTKNGVTNNSSAADMAGVGLITVGTGAADASLIYAGEFGGGAGGNATIGNNITVSGSGTNLIATPNWALIVTGTLNLNSADVILGQCNPGSILGIYGWLSFNGGVTGTGSITATNSAGSANPYVEFNTKPVNHSGGLTFNNASVLGAPVGTGNGENKITGGVGSNVQFITQASNSNPLTISAGSVTVNPAGLVLNSTGSALLTVSSPTTGSGQLTLNSNSTGGITLSGALGHGGL